MDRGAIYADAAARANVSVEIIEASMVEVAEPFDLLLSSLVDEAALSAVGSAFTERWLSRLIAGRTRLRLWAEHDSEVESEAIVAPVVVAGAPRTGTTFLHGLLAQLPGVRAPEGWELLFPSPPPESHTPDDDSRVIAADEELIWPQQRNDSIMSIHRYAGRMYKECLSAMSFAFRSEEFVSRYRVPAYAEWLGSCDMTPAYEMHRCVLQSLQRRRQTKTWVLKSPVHLNNLPTVLATYPDARIVITHREPTEILGSVTSLIVNLRRAFSDSVDEMEIARYHLGLYARSLDQLVNLDPPEGSIVHIGQRELIADPQQTIDTISEQLSLPRITLDAAPPAEVGQHEYHLTGVDGSEIDAAFARYRERFLSGS